MAKFLNTSATNYYLEELIKNASDRLILISPFLKLNDRLGFFPVFSTPSVLGSIPKIIMFNIDTFLQEGEI